jgi:hypothetical protein
MTAVAIELCKPPVDEEIVQQAFDWIVRRFERR